MIGKILSDSILQLTALSLLFQIFQGRQHSTPQSVRSALADQMSIGKKPILFFLLFFVSICFTGKIK